MGGTRAVNDVRKSECGLRWGGRPPALVSFPLRISRGICRLILLSVAIGHERMSLGNCSQ